jgi:hypothetical protein
MREDACIDTFNSGHGKDCVDLDGSVSEQWEDMNAGALETLFTEHEVRLHKGAPSPLEPSTTSSLAVLPLYTHLKLLLVLRLNLQPSLRMIPASRNPWTC